MNNEVALQPAPLAPPFVTDADDVASAWLSLAMTQRRLAKKYRDWAGEATTEAERDKWAAEADRCSEGADWHFEKYRQWSDPNG